MLVTATSPDFENWTSYFELKIKKYKAPSQTKSRTRLSYPLTLEVLMNTVWKLEFIYLFDKPIN